MGGKAGGGLQAAGGNYSGQWKEGKYGALGTDLLKDNMNTVILAGQGKNIQKGLGMDNSKQKKKMKESAAVREEQNYATRGALDQMSKYDDDFLGKISKMDDEASLQSRDARRAYTNQIAPRLKGIMEEAGKQAGSAMSLKDAGDVNNSVHQAVRKLYDDQAQGVRKQGLADSGVLAAMGQQATANQMGVGGPMTGSQLQLLSANNQQQSGLAYARAQQEMNRLREQGIDRGFNESSNQYERGQRAIDRYQGSVGNFEQGLDNNIARQRGFRTERTGYGDMTHGLESGGSLRDLGYIDQVYGGKQEGINQAIAMANAQNAAKSGIMTGVLGAAGSIAGGYFGGPAGAAAGGQTGNAVGQGAAGYGQAPVYSSQTANANRYGTYQNYGYQNQNQQPQRY